MTFVYFYSYRQFFRKHFLEVQVITYLSIPNNQKIKKKKFLFTGKDNSLSNLVNNFSKHTYLDYYEAIYRV